MLSPIGVSEKGGRPGLVLLGSCFLKQSILLVDYHDFSLVIGPIIIAEKHAESHGSVGEGLEGRAGAGGQLFLETELPIGGLP